MVKRATSPEDFNNAAARNVLKNWYEDNPLIRDRAWKTDKIFNKNIDEQLKGTSSSIGYPIRKQVQRMIHSGKTEGEIADALTKAIGNLGTEFGNESGTFANSDMREEVAVVDLLVRNLQSQNPDVTGKTDDELNQIYSDFSAYLDRNLDKMFKDMSFENRKALVSHIKSDKDNVDKLIKEQAMNLLKQKGSSYDASGLLRELSGGMDPSNLDMAIAGLYTISSDPNASAEDRSNYITNFDATAAEEQQDLKVNPPAAPAATGDAADPAGGDAAADLLKPKEVHFQGRDGNWYKAMADFQGNYVTAPTLVGEDVAQRAIAREDAIYGRNRADQLRDAATRRSQDLSDLSSLYDRQDSLYGRDIAREDALYGRDTARDDFIYGRNRADYLDDRVAEWAREDAIRQGNWTREDELMYRGRNWELQDIYDQRLYDEAQAAEDKTFRTAELGMQLAPTYMDSQLDAAKFEADILRNAGDYISAAFMQRGEPSPFTPVTQADMVNQYRKYVRDMMDATSAGFRSPYLEDTSWANIAPPRSAGEAPPPPPPAAPSAGAKPAGAAAPAAGSAKPDDTKPAASSAGAATTAPAGVGPVGDGKVPLTASQIADKAVIDAYEAATAPFGAQGFQSSPVGTEFGAGMGSFVPPENRDYEAIGREFGAVGFQPPEQPRYAPPAGPAVGSEFGDGAFVPPEGSLQPPSGGVIHIPSNPVRPPEGGVIHIPSSPTPGREFGDNQFIPPEQPVQPPQSQIFGMPANTGMSDIEQINMISEQLDAPQSVLPPTGGVMHIPSTQMQETFNYSDDAYVNPAQAAYDAQQAMAAQAAANIGTPVGGYVSGFNTPEQNPFYQHHPAMGYSGPEEESFSFTEDVFRPAPVDIQQSGFSPEGNNAIESRRPPQAPMFKLPEPKPTYYDFEF